MLFKSATGDLNNEKDCSLCSLNKNLWLFPKKIVYSSIAQSVERMTVNHDVTGSSPVGGAKKGCKKFLQPFNLHLLLYNFL